MKTTNLRRLGKMALAGIATLLVLNITLSTAAEPKRVLVVTVTKGFRHSSIPTAEKALADIAEKSGAFVIEYARVEPKEPQFKGPDGKPDKARVDAAIEKVLAEKMSPAALKTYDGIIFANTTGDLPLPDKDAFLNWIKSGKAFVGMHAATDTFRGRTPLDPFIEMIGGEFKSHPPGLQEVECINQDPAHPACRHLGPVWSLKDEIYIFNGFERSKVHGLLTLDKHPHDKTPGDYPVAWSKSYGKGRVFYTSLGHSEAMWEDPKYQKHILGGIKWALGLEQRIEQP
jgi:uncharacterized protein